MGIFLGRKNPSSGKANSKFRNSNSQNFMLSRRRPGKIDSVTRVLPDRL